MALFDPMKKESLTYCPFTKHLGKTWAEVIDEDKQYVEWLISGEGPKIDPDLEEKLTDLLEKWDSSENIADTMYNTLKGRLLGDHE